MAAIRNSRGFGTPARQRGVAAIFAALALIALLAAVGIAIDLSRFYFAQRDLQRTANAAALDAARVAGGCMGVPANPDGAALSEATQSVLRNGGKLTDISNGSVTVGRMLRDDSTGVRSFATGSDDKNRAVQVVLRRDAPSRLIPIPGIPAGPSLRMSATAAAQSRPIVTLAVGTSVANVSNGILGPVLGTLLGTAPNIGVVSYQGLIAQTVQLGQIADASGQTVQQFLDTPVGLRQLLSNVLNAVAGTATPTVTAGLSAIRDATNPALTVLPSQVIQVVGGYEDALGSANVSVGALVTQLAQAAVGDTSIDLPLNLSLPLIGNIDLNAHLITPGTIAAIPAGVSPDTGFPDSVAANAQGLVQLNVSLLPILGNAVNLKLFVKAAQATAALDDIHCARRGQTQHEIDVKVRPQLAHIGIGEYDDISKPNPTVNPTLLVNVLGLVKVYGKADIVIGQNCAIPAQFQGPPFPTPTQHFSCPLGQSLSDAIASLPSNLVITTQPAVIGALLQPVVNSVLALLTPAIATALTTLDPVLNGLLATLGLSVGTADVSVTDVTNDQPYLFVKSK